MSSFVLCARNKEGQGFGGRTSAPSYLMIADDAVEPSQADIVTSYVKWLAEIRAAAQREDGTNRALVFFVHGYNTPPREALLRQRRVERELAQRGCHCLLIGFDWPTGGSAAAYTYDRFQAQAAAGYLVSSGLIPFAKSSRIDCPLNVHVMAHSMGAFVVREAFRMLDKARDADLSNDWRVGQMVFFGADVSSSCFALDHPDMLPVFTHCGRLTNYFSGYDKALAVSNVKNIDIEARVGRVGMPVDTPSPEKAVDVDCGPRYDKAAITKFTEIDGMISHSWYLEDAVWYDDLAHTIRGELDRNAIPTRRSVGASDFVLHTDPQ
jgi:esterase/lipase superfamily enzyme